MYFDEYEFNYCSRYTGEARIVHEINTGMYGDGIELILDTELSLNSKRVYRFINCNAKTKYQQKEKLNSVGGLHRRTNDSPLP